jgi:DNA recombination protein RmuC
MEIIAYIFVGIILGALVGWLLAKAKSASAIQAEKEAAQLKYSELEKELIGYKATVTSQLNTANDNLNAKMEAIAELKQINETNAKEMTALNSRLSTANADLRAANQTILDKNASMEAITKELNATKTELSTTNQTLASAKATNDALNDKLETQKKEIEALGKKFNMEFENIANKILDTKRRNSPN